MNRGPGFTGVHEANLGAGVQGSAPWPRCQCLLVGTDGIDRRFCGRWHDYQGRVAPARGLPSEALAKGGWES